MTITEVILLMVLIASNMLWFIKYAAVRHAMTKFAEMWQKELLARLDDFIVEQNPARWEYRDWLH